MTSKVKNPTTFDEQINKLKSRKCIIEDENYATKILSEIGYYRLSAYFLPYKNIDDNYKEGTSFNQVVANYEFDRELRNILFAAIEEVEVALRSYFSYYHSHKYGSLGYKSEEIYNDRHNHEGFMAKFDEEVQHNKNAPFVRHHIEKYDSEFPIWVASELFTFGMLSYFYSDLLTSDQKQIAKDMYNENHNNIKSWLRCCTDLRNMCAHYARLYYKNFPAIPSRLPKEIRETSERRLFGAIYALKKLYPDEKKWRSEIVSQITELIGKHKDNIDLKHIGFPENWRKILLDK